MADRYGIPEKHIALSGEQDPRDRNCWDDVQLLPDGAVKLADGTTFTVDQESADRVIEAFADQGADLSIDIEHAQLPWHPGGVPKGAAAPSYGWMKNLKYAAGRGITARVDWTDDGADLVRSQKYKYLSPVIRFDADGNPKRIHSAALTHKPAIQFAEALRAASETLEGSIKMPKGKTKKATKPWMETLKALQEDPAAPETPTTEADLGVIVGEIKAALGIDVEDGATLTQMLIAIRDKVKSGDGGGDDGGDAAAEVAASIKECGKLLACAEDAAPKDIVLALKELKAGGKTSAEFKALSERVKTAEATLKEQATDKLIAKYTGSEPDNFKINPDDADRLKLCHEMASENPERFEKWMDTMPVVVQQGAMATGPIASNLRDRGKIIAASEREYDADPSLTRMGTERAAFHNFNLQEAGLKPMTDEELEKIAV